MWLWTDTPARQEAADVIPEPRNEARLMQQIDDALAIDDQYRDAGSRGYLPPGGELYPTNTELREMDAAEERRYHRLLALVARVVHETGHPLTSARQAISIAIAALRTITAPGESLSADQLCRAGRVGRSLWRAQESVRESGAHLRIIPRDLSATADGTPLEAA